MKSVALIASTTLIAMTMVACSGGETPTSPSQATRSFAPVSGNFPVNGGFIGTSAVLSDAENDVLESNSNYNLIQVAVLAEQHGDRGEVKMFGRQLGQDFTDAQDQLGDIAGIGVVRAGLFDVVDQATYSSLSAMSGSEFDRAFVTAIIVELTSTRERVRELGTTASSSKVSDHADAMESMLSRYISMAIDLDTYL